jgi:hypothetical protein
MASVQVIRSEREPGVVQLFVTGADVSAAYIAGTSQATWWLSTEEARQLRQQLTDKLAAGESEHSCPLRLGGSDHASQMIPAKRSRGSVI